MDYTAALRQAHINSLRQKYLDIIEDARLEKEQKQLEYDDRAQDAYIERMNEARDRPQQLRAAGLGGGIEQSELGDIVLEYQNQLETLKKEREQFISEFNRIVEVQTREMNNALAEYNARIALEDAQQREKEAQAAAKAAASASGSSGRTAYSTSVTKKSGVPSTSGGKFSTTSSATGPNRQGTVISYFR